jgi:hypothetical protein
MCVAIEDALDNLEPSDVRSRVDVVFGAQKSRRLRFEIVGRARRHHATSAIHLEPDSRFARPV